MKPRYSAPTYNEIPPIEHAYFGPKMYMIGNKENLGFIYDYYQSIEMRYTALAVP